VFTSELPPERVHDTSIPAFEAAAVAFHEAGGAFTSIRHGTVVAGSEDCAYEIVNATQPCAESTVPRGVLARVASEALRIEATHHSMYGVSSSGAFAGAYLNILRASGLSRQQEVEKIFKGGIQRVAQLVQKAKEENCVLSEQENDSAELYTVKKILNSLVSLEALIVTQILNHDRHKISSSHTRFLQRLSPQSVSLARRLSTTTSRWISLRTKSSNQIGTYFAYSAAPRSC